MLLAPALSWAHAVLFFSNFGTAAWQRAMYSFCQINNSSSNIWEEVRSMPVTIHYWNLFNCTVELEALLEVYDCASVGFSSINSRNGVFLYLVCGKVRLNFHAGPFAVREGEIKQLYSGLWHNFLDFRPKKWVSIHCSTRGWLVPVVSM